MREIDDWITAKSLGERLDISGRSVSGSFRKLVTNGYVEKRAGNPTSYRLTELGKTCELIIEDDNLDN
jgi:Mn-dependent DtxR family transcriptional regulator